MVEYVEHHGISIDHDLYRFINDEAIVEIGIESDQFWSGFSQIITDFALRNRALLQRRDELQASARPMAHFQSRQRYRF